MFSPNDKEMWSKIFGFAKRYKRNDIPKRRQFKCLEQEEEEEGELGIFNFAVNSLSHSNQFASTLASNEF